MLANPPAVRSVSPELAQNEGTTRLQTPMGFLVYLALISSYAGIPNDAGRGHIYAALNEGNDIMAEGWNPHRDQLTFICLTGEWFLSGPLDWQGLTEKRFPQEIPGSFVNSNAADARQIVNEIVRKEMEQFEAETPEEEEFLRFLKDCLILMGSIITGTTVQQHVRQLMRSSESQLVNTGFVFHELLRRESLILWDELQKHALAERSLPLSHIVSEMMRLAETAGAPAAESAQKVPAGKLERMSRLLRRRPRRS